LDFKFFFFAWWQNPENVADPEGVVFTTQIIEYVDMLRDVHKIKLTQEQVGWYQIKAEALGEDIYREHPSFPEEAFLASQKGTYYGDIIARMRNDNRIGSVPHEPALPVFTCWDLGMDDSTTIWAFQVFGTEKRLINYYEASGPGLEHYAGKLRDWAQDYGYIYAEHYLPHDVAVRELGTGKSRKATLFSLGVMPIVTAPKPKNAGEVLEQIDIVRMFLKTTRIDESKCDLGIKCLESYYKAWDPKTGAYKTSPAHTWASHGADALRTGAVAFMPEILGEENWAPEEEAVY
jgi:hypothetical protein